MAVAGIEVAGPPCEAADEILTPDALELLAFLHRSFDVRRRELLALRVTRDEERRAGRRLGFLDETAAIRADRSWRIAPLPADLRDRRVEITGPVDRKMVINALNSGARTFMADFEDSNCPTWANCVTGQQNLRDAVRRSIEFASPDGRQYRLNDTTAVLLVRPRGWHLDEKHVLVDGEPIAASLFDFGLYLFHNHGELAARGTGPYFYLPKLESHLEARLWNDVFIAAQQRLGIAPSTIRATVLIETLPAAFEMEEILYELRDHSAGLNCGRWDYLFSAIKTFRHDPSFVLADRRLLTMTTRFMRSYSLLAISTCHRRGAPAIGGMAAQIPIKNDPDANAEAIAKVRADKEREVGDGHDGTWVAHPGLVPVALEAFDAGMPGDNQIERQRDDVVVTEDDLLAFEPTAPITEAGLRTNLRVAVQYIGSWLAGNGCVPIHNLMEDAATAEISRSQVWQWVHATEATLDDGRSVDIDLVQALLAEELAVLEGESPAPGSYDVAAKLVEDLVAADDFTLFLTLPAYDLID